MTATAFDTLSTARDLEAAGFERRQAEALAGAVRQASATDREALATKTDLAELRAETKADIAEFRAEMKADLAEFRAATKTDLANFATKADLDRKVETLRSEMRWMFTFQGALILAIAARLFGLV